MTNEEKLLISGLVTMPGSSGASLTPEEFLNKFGASVGGKELALQLLRDANLSCDGDALGFAMILGFTFGFSRECLSELIPLVTADWHHSHEDVVTALSGYATPDVVEALCAATQWIPEYLDYDDSRSLATKAIWALGKITGTEAEDVLLRLADSRDSILRETARMQLRRRRSGEVS